MAATKSTSNPANLANDFDVSENRRHSALVD